MEVFCLSMKLLEGLLGQKFFEDEKSYFTLKLRGQSF